MANYGDIGEVYLRAEDIQIDLWEKAGSLGWNWDSLWQYYKKSEELEEPSQQALDNGITYNPASMVTDPSTFRFRAIKAAATTSGCLMSRTNPLASRISWILMVAICAAFPHSQKHGVIQEITLKSAKVHLRHTSSQSRTGATCTC